MKRFLVFLLAAVFIFSFFGCDSGDIRADDIKFIEVRKGSFKTEYSIDEEIDFDNAYIVITLKQDKGEIVEKIKPEMVEGFDTSTTAEAIDMRAMRVKYKGIYTSHWYYEVTDKHDINTQARLKMRERQEDNDYKIEVDINLNDLERINAVQMEINYDSSVLEIDQLRSRVKDWEIIEEETEDNKLGIIIYAAPSALPITNDCAFMEIVFNKVSSDEADVELNNIVLSDGERDINLPDVSL